MLKESASRGLNFYLCSLGRAGLYHSLAHGYHAYIAAGWPATLKLRQGDIRNLGCVNFGMWPVSNIAKQRFNSNTMGHGHNAAMALLRRLCLCGQQPRIHTRANLTH